MESARENQISDKETIDVDDGQAPVTEAPQTRRNTHENTENEYEFVDIDVVWLKKDVRWTDHGPLSDVVGGGAAFRAPEQQRRKFVILYLYEPDQLREHSVHGSHLRFVHEGLLDMDDKLREPAGGTGAAQQGEELPTAATRPKDVTQNSTTAPASFRYLTVCHNTIVSTLNAIHFRYPATPPKEEPNKKKTCYKIARLLSHEETGHWGSYTRDRSVRKWCKTRGIPFVEFNQNGVTRRLEHRDDYLKLWKAFMAKPLHAKIDLESGTGRAAVKSRLVQLKNLPGFVTSPRRGIANLFETGEKEPRGEDRTENEADSGKRILAELPAIHRSDRPGRQQSGGETRARNTLESFLSERGANYSQHISSPNTSWNSCSRLSVYLTWGHISLRCVLRALRDRQDRLRKSKTKSTWLRSLQAFASRAHWRSHFVQKLESEPLLEKRDLCPAYQHLRRQDGDWDQEKYAAWETGRTGYPFVDACMRCLIEHGWLNFRMRAMLVSFATYNLWLDWKRIAPHLARVFLDYEPGIHYLQLQMQAGTTGINAMRVYNVTKQGKDQDPKGIFIRRYVPELRNVPDQYIHEPWKMPEALKDKCYKNKTPLFAISQPTPGDSISSPYPEPIVDEKESARIAKAKVNAVKKAVATRIQANRVYIKHGSRSRQSNEMNHRVSGSGALPAALAAEAGAAARGKNDPIRQPNIKDAFSAAAASSAQKKHAARVVDLTTQPKNNPTKRRLQDATTAPNESSAPPTKKPKSASVSKTGGSATNRNVVGRKPHPIQTKISSSAAKALDSSTQMTHSGGSWNCTACTFLNEKPHGLVCTMCGTAR